MKRYVIVCLIKGEAQEFHEKLVNEVCERYKVKAQKLPMHITLKAPFEIEDIREVEEVTQNFCALNKASSITIKDFGYFRQNVIFMDVIPSKEAMEVHDSYMDVLLKIKDLEWSRNEGKGRKFHCTIVSKRIEDSFNEIWDYVNKHKAEFPCELDNISILEYNHKSFKWDLYKSFNLK